MYDATLHCCLAVKVHPLEYKYKYGVITVVAKTNISQKLRPKTRKLRPLIFFIFTRFLPLFLFFLTIFLKKQKDLGLPSLVLDIFFITVYSSFNFESEFASKVFAKKEA